MTAVAPVTTAAGTMTAFGAGAMAPPGSP